MGFTIICAKLPAMEVAELLNTMYMIFDDMIERKDIYKVNKINTIWNKTLFDIL